MTLLEKVDYLLNIAKNGTCSDAELASICAMTSESSDHVRLGKIMGYSVSDYAIATLKWLHYDDLFESFFEPLETDSKKHILNLIESKLYLEI